MEFLIVVLLILVALILLQSSSTVGGFIPMSSSSTKYVMKIYKFNNSGAFSDILVHARVNEDKDKRSEYKINDYPKLITKFINDNVRFFAVLYAKGILKFSFENNSLYDYFQIKKEPNGELGLNGNMLKYIKSMDNESYLKDYMNPVLEQLPQEAKDLYKKLEDKIYSAEIKYNTYNNAFQALGGTRKNIWYVEIKNLGDTYSIIIPDSYKSFKVKKNGTLLEKMKSIINEEQKKGWLGISFEYQLKKYIEKNIPNKGDFIKRLENFVNKSAEKVPTS